MSSRGERYFEHARCLPLPEGIGQVGKDIGLVAYVWESCQWQIIQKWCVKNKIKFKFTGLKIVVIRKCCTILKRLRSTNCKPIFFTTYFQYWNVYKIWNWLELELSKPTLWSQLNWFCPFSKNYDSEINYESVKLNWSRSSSSVSW